MGVHEAGWLLIVLGVALANVPWLMEKRIVLGLVPLAQCKRMWMALLEWSIYMILWIGAGLLLEWRVTGTIQPQAWEFWTTMIFLFMIFAFPGFIYRYNFQRFLGKSA